MKHRASGRSIGLAGALLAVIAAAVFAGAAVAEEKPVVGGPMRQAQASARPSPHILAAKRRAEQARQGTAQPPRVGLQAMMRKDAARRHVAPGKRGS